MKFQDVLLSVVPFMVFCIPYYFMESIDRTPSALGSRVQVEKRQKDRLDQDSSDISEQIKTEMLTQGIPIELVQSTGIITLKMDDYFRNNDSNLSVSSKMKLKKFFPAYVKGLFHDPYLLKKIRNISITGFSSPRYRQKYLNPFENNPEAFSYNLGLSIARAQKMIEFALGVEIGEYPFKKEFRPLVVVSGQGHLSPIPLDPTLPSDEPCPPFDCARSRRIEIKFVLN